MTDPLAPTREDFKLRDLRWQEIELELDRIQAEQRTISGVIERSKQQLNPAAWAQFDILGEQHRILLIEQQEIEEFLIENEAPGWTST